MKYQVSFPAKTSYLHISSHVKRSPSLWLHNKSHLWKQADLVFHWCLYNKQNITYSLMDMNFIFSCSTRYLTRSLRPLVRYRVDHSKIKFISTHGHVISSMDAILNFVRLQALKDPLPRHQIHWTSWLLLVLVLFFARIFRVISPYLTTPSDS